MEQLMTPFSMLTGKNAGTGLVIIGLLVALAIAAKQKSTAQAAVTS